MMMYQNLAPGLYSSSKAYPKIIAGYTMYNSPPFEYVATSIKM
jgi:hypothetical protein